mmetsp:Transcript_39757/g.82657  ORF Transcript_39757/g.82657 Transcript_39757/m.82657 type:complete len:1265 (-) Transcript_39757:514-4308(-)
MEEEDHSSFSDEEMHRLSPGSRRTNDPFQLLLENGQAQTSFLTKKGVWFTFSCSNGLNGIEKIVKVTLTLESDATATDVAVPANTERLSNTKCVSAFNTFCENFGVETLDLEFRTKRQASLSSPMHRLLAKLMKSIRKVPTIKELRSNLSTTLREALVQESIQYNPNRLRKLAITNSSNIRKAHSTNVSEILFPILMDGRDLEEITLRHFKFDSQDLVLIQNALKSGCPRLRSFQMDYCKLPQEKHMKFLTEVLNDHRKLERICVRDDSATSWKNVENVEDRELSFSRAVLHHGTIQQIYLPFGYLSIRESMVLFGMLDYIYDPRPASYLEFSSCERGSSGASRGISSRGSGMSGTVEFNVWGDLAREMAVTDYLNKIVGYRCNTPIKMTYSNDGPFSSAYEVFRFLKGIGNCRKQTEYVFPFVAHQQGILVEMLKGLANYKSSAQPQNRPFISLKISRPSDADNSNKIGIKIRAKSRHSPFLELKIEDFGRNLKIQSFLLDIARDHRDLTNVKVVGFDASECWDGELSGELAKSISDLPIKYICLPFTKSHHNELAQFLMGLEVATYYDKFELETIDDFQRISLVGQSESTHVCLDIVCGYENVCGARLFLEILKEQGSLLSFSILAEAAAWTQSEIASVANLLVSNQPKLTALKLPLPSGDFQDCLLKVIKPCWGNSVNLTLYSGEKREWFTIDGRQKNIEMDIPRPKEESFSIEHLSRQSKTSKEDKDVGERKLMPFLMWTLSELDGLKFFRVENIQDHELLCCHQSYDLAKALCRHPTLSKACLPFLEDGFGDAMMSMWPKKKTTLPQLQLGGPADDCTISLGCQGRQSDDLFVTLSMDIHRRADESFSFGRDDDGLLKLLQEAQVGYLHIKSKLVSPFVSNFIFNPIKAPHVVVSDLEVESYDQDEMNGLSSLLADYTCLKRMNLQITSSVTMIPSSICPKSNLTELVLRVSQSPNRSTAARAVYNSIARDLVCLLLREHPTLVAMTLHLPDQMFLCNRDAKTTELWDLLRNHPSLTSFHLHCSEGPGECNSPFFNAVTENKRLRVFELGCTYEAFKFKLGPIRYLKELQLPSGASLQGVRKSVLRSTSVTTIHIKQNPQYWRKSRRDPIQGVLQRNRLLQHVQNIPQTRILRTASLLPTILSKLGSVKYRPLVEDISQNVMPPPIFDGSPLMAFLQTYSGVFTRCHQEFRPPSSPLVQHPNDAPEQQLDIEQEERAMLRHGSKRRRNQRHRKAKRRRRLQALAVFDSKAKAMDDDSLL